MSTILVGYTAKAIQGLEHLIALPQPPSNYGPQAAEEWRRDPARGGLAAQTAIFESSFSKFTGRLESVYAVDPSRRSVFRDDTPQVATNFLKWVLDGYPRAFPTLPGRTARGVSFWGFDVKAFTRVLGIECCLAGAVVPIGLWYENQECYSPYEMLVEADRRKILPLTKLVDSLGVARPSDWRPHKDPAVDVRITAELMASFHLVQATPEESLSELVERSLPPVMTTEADNEDDDA